MFQTLSFMTAMSPTYHRYSTDTIPTAVSADCWRLLTGKHWPTTLSVDTQPILSADTRPTVYRPTVGRGWLKWTWSHFWWCHLLPFSNVASSMGGNYRIPGHIHTCTWSNSTNQKIFEQAFTLTPARLCRTGDKIFFPNIELLVIFYSFSVRKS